MYDQITTPTAEVVERLTREADTPWEIRPGLYLNKNTSGTPSVVDARDQIERCADHPRRKTGAVVLTQQDSFVAYLAKHALAETEIWADQDADQIVAVINAGAHATGPGTATQIDPDALPAGATETPNPGRAGWGDHRAGLRLKTTPDWRAWNANSGKLLPQIDFSEFVEQHLPNFLRPTAADILELAQTIKGATKVSFESSKRVKSGETAIEWREDTQATAGKRGTIDIPDTIDLGMQVYEGGAPYKLTARFRYRITGGSLVLGYVLERPEDVHRDAFGQVVQQVSADTHREVWHGTP